MKKLSSIISKFLSVVLALALLFSAYVFFSSMRAGKNGVPSVFGFSFLRVATGSMEPTIPTGSLVIMHKTDPADVQVGDIICFYSTDPQIMGMPNTHRVTEIRQENGSLSFVTQGDASMTPDAYPVTPDRLVGKYVTDWQVGKVLDVMHSPYFFVALVFLLIIVIFVEFLHVKRAALLRKENDDAPDD